MIPNLDEKLEALKETFLPRDEVKKFDYKVQNLEKDNALINSALNAKFEEFKQNSKEIEMFKVEMMKYVDVKEINLLRSRIDGVDNNLVATRKNVTDLDKKVKIIYSKNRDSCDQAAIDKIVAEVKQLKSDFEDLKEDATQKLNFYEEEFPMKAYKSDVLDAENRLMLQFKDILDQLVAKLCQKDETNKKFLTVSKKMKDIMDLLGSQGLVGISNMAGGNESNAMFSKMPLRSAACASCEKDLVNINGSRVDHYNWNKLPFRDPNERIAKFGQGFSNRLSMISSKASKMDIVKTSYRHSRQNKSIESIPLNLIRTEE